MLFDAVGHRLEASSEGVLPHQQSISEALPQPPCNGIEQQLN